MASPAQPSNPLKAWLSELLFSRALFQGPDARPLYQYQLTEQEFTSLTQLLKRQLPQITNKIYQKYFGACFCLFVSEHYRRAYDSNWSWAGAEDALGTELTPSLRARLTELGLGYWKRSIRKRENGRDFLGSLFSEGGLPWPLVQSDTHIFGRAVRRGIKQYYRTESDLCTTADIIAQTEQDWPGPFQTLETRQLLAGIVDHLMFLAESYPIKGKEDPASFLDEVAKGWTTGFPIPLDTENARLLLNDWLKDAEQKRSERQAEKARQFAFTSEHYLQGPIENWTLSTQLHLPEVEEIAFDLNTLTSTRLETSYYEGDRILARGKAIYAQITDNGLKVRFPQQILSLVRRDPSEPVTLHLQDAGRSIHVFHFENSAVDYQEGPLTFTEQDEAWKLTSSASCTLPQQQARVRLPEGCSVIAGIEHCDEQSIDHKQGFWFDICGTVALKKGNDHYLIELNQEASTATRPSLGGTLALFQSNPSTVYLGWPRLNLPDEYTYSRHELDELANNNIITSLDRHQLAGTIRYALRQKNGNTLMRRRFAVLPQGFNLRALPARGEQPALLLLKNAQALEINCIAPGLITERLERDGEVELRLHPQGDELPAQIILELRNGPQIQPVQVRLPYPYQGARLILPNGDTSRENELLLHELIGHQIALTSASPQGQEFFLQLELVSRARFQAKRHFAIHVGSIPVQLSLFSYEDQIHQMLSAIDDQDAYVRLSVESERPLLSLNIRRFNGQLNWEDTDSFMINEPDGDPCFDAATVRAMLISDPKQEPLMLESDCSQGVATGCYPLPQKMQQKGTWLIYPDAASKIQFRPVLSIPRTQDPAAPVDFSEVHSLHQATELFHPLQNPDVVNQQVAAMAEDFDHSGWQYLADLKQRYAHLPLSTFESWRALSRNPQALAFAMLRLELDDQFCQRIGDELAVIWEEISLPNWCLAYQRFLRGLKDAGLPAALIQNLEQNRAGLLRLIVPGFDHLGSYLTTGDPQQLCKFPPELVLPGWYQDLRRRHESNRHWPVELSSALKQWVEQQHLPDSIKRLSQVGFADAVCYLPIFLGFVSAGQAKLKDLGIKPTQLKFSVRLLADFDRQDWFAPVHALMTSYLLASTEHH